jgi:hypothetical protein
MTELDRFRQARDRGCDYLLRQQRPDGGFGPEERGLADYYKVPSAYVVCGESMAAARLCDWVRRCGMTTEGDFGPRLPETLDYYYLYYNAWVISGAHRQGHFDLSRKGMDFLLGFWDSASGGFYSSRTDRSAETKQDLWVTSGGGVAALYMGHFEVACGVGRWMKQLVDLQPDFPKRLFSVYSRAGGVHTSYPAADEIRYVLNASATRDEYFFQPGIAAGFLAQLYKATGGGEWLELARQYLRFAEGASDFLFHSLRAGKVGWASALLYTLTSESKYREMAIRVGDNLIAAQGPDGAWSTNLLSCNDATAEMVVWLDEIDQAVGGSAG